MKLPPEAYGDNFPVVEGRSWDPRAPWRHAHVTPTAPPTWLRRLGWWTLVAALMGLLVFMAAQDGFSEETFRRAATGELIIQFREGALEYPEGVQRALLHQVAFLPRSLQRLNAQYGLVAVERVTSPTRVTAQTYRLLFASRAGVERTLRAYRHNPYVISAELLLPTRRNPEASPSPADLPTLDA